MRLVTTRLRVLTALALSAVALLAATAPATAGGLRVKVAGTSSRPSVGDRWTLTVTAKKNGKPAAGRVRVDVLMGGKVVRTVAANDPLSGGRWSITQKWPGIAKGRSMTFRGTVTSGGSRGTGSFTVHVRG